MKYINGTKKLNKYYGHLLQIDEIYLFISSNRGKIKILYKYISISILTFDKNS